MHRKDSASAFDSVGLRFECEMDEEVKYCEDVVSVPGKLASRSHAFGERHRANVPRGRCSDIYTIAIHPIITLPLNLVI